MKRSQTAIFSGLVVVLFSLIITIIVLSAQNDPEAALKSRIDKILGYYETAISNTDEAAIAYENGINDLIYDAPINLKAGIGNINAEQMIKAFNARSEPLRTIVLKFGIKGKKIFDKSGCIHEILSNLRIDALIFATIKFNHDEPILCSEHSSSSYCIPYVIDENWKGFSSGEILPSHLCGKFSIKNLPHLMSDVALFNRLVSGKNPRSSISILSCYNYSNQFDRGSCLSILTQRNRELCNRWQYNHLFSTDETPHKLSTTGKNQCDCRPSPRHVLSEIEQELKNYDNEGGSLDNEKQLEKSVDDIFQDTKNINRERHIVDNPNELRGIFREVLDEDNKRKLNDQKPTFNLLPI